MSTEARVGIKFFGDSKDAQRSIDELREQNAKYAQEAVARSQKSKAESAEQIATIKRWQAANNEAMGQHVELVRKREQLVKSATEVSQKAQRDEAKAAYKFDQERLAHKQDLFRRLKEMEDQAALRAYSGGRSMAFRGAMNTQTIDQSARDKTAGIIAQVRAAGAAKVEPSASLIDSAAGSLTKYATVAAIAYKVVQQINNEWQNVIDRQEKAGRVKLTQEAALAEAVLNIGGVMSPEKILEHALTMSAESGVALPSAIQAISLAVKSGGATSEAEAERLVPAARAAARLTPAAGAESIASTAGAISSIMMLKEVSAEQAAGKIMDMQAMTNIAYFNKAMETMAPALSAGLAAGASDEFATALAPSLSQALNDEQGDQSKLAATKYFLSLQEVFGERAKAAGRTDIADFALEQLRADPNLSRDFWEGELVNERTGRKFGKPEVGHGAAEPFLRTISGDKSLQGDPKIQGEWLALLEKNKARTKTLEESGKLFDERMEQVQRATPTKQVEKAFTSATERAQLEGDDAMRGVIRDKLKELLQATGESDLYQKLTGTEFDLSSGSGIEFGIKELEERARGKRLGSYGFFDALLGDKSFTEMESRAADAGTEKQAQNLDRATEVLRDIKKLLEDEKNPNRRRNGNVEDMGGGDF